MHAHTRTASVYIHHEHPLSGALILSLFSLFSFRYLLSLSFPTDISQPPKSQSRTYCRDDESTVICTLASVLVKLTCDLLRTCVLFTFELLLVDPVLLPSFLLVSVRIPLFSSTSSVLLFQSQLVTFRNPENNSSLRLATEHHRLPPPFFRLLTTDVNALKQAGCTGKLIRSTPKPPTDLFGVANREYVIKLGRPLWFSEYQRVMSGKKADQTTKLNSLKR